MSMKHKRKIVLFIAIALLSSINNSSAFANYSKGGNAMSEQTAVKKLPSRSEISTEDTWNLEDIFESNEAWEKEFTEIKSALPKLAEFKGKLGESANTLYEALTYQDQVMERLGKLYTYSHMK